MNWQSGGKLGKGVMQIGKTNIDVLRFSCARYGNVVGNIYIRKVEKKGSALVNSVIKTYPNVSQFWTYNADEFLKKPVYNRESWPENKNLEP